MATLVYEERTLLETVFSCSGFKLSLILEGEGRSSLVALGASLEQYF